MTTFSFPLVAFGAHPDDVELACAGILAAFADCGGKAAIVDLTAGEKASRGSLEGRAEEANQAASCLGASRYNVRIPDAEIAAASEGQRAVVVKTLRQLKPQFVLLPHPGDPHPDHRQASLLIQDAVFLAGVSGYQPSLGEPHRPPLLLAYPGPRQASSPDLVVDVTRTYEKKREALSKYASQFDPATGSRTHLASGYFLQAIEGRDRAFGNLIGVPYGEGLFFLGPVHGGFLENFLRNLVCA